MEAHMRRPYRLYLLALSFALGAASNVLAEDPTFTPITFPGATFTQTWGIDARGDIVGLYVDVGNVTHGFLLSGGNFTTIDAPPDANATSTFPYGINPRGDIVGSYVSAGVTRGFLLSGGKFTTINFPGAISTEVVGISPRGDIVGDYSLARLT